MKVLLANSETEFRGGESQTLALARSLSAAGHECTIAARAGSALAERARLEGVSRVELPFEKLPIVTPWRLARLIARARPDVLHAQTADAHTHLWIARGLVRSAPPLVVSRRVAFRIRKTPLALLKYRRGVARFAPISRAAARSLVEIGVPPERMTIVPSGVETARFASIRRGEAPRAGSPVPPGRFAVGTVAALEREKGLEVLIAAASRVARERPDAFFVIAGEGSLASKLSREAGRAGVAGAVAFLSASTPIEQVLPLLDLYVLPSIEEGLSTALLAAMAAGLAVVASDTGGIPDAVTPSCGILVPPGNSDALAGAILGLMADPNARGAMGREGALRAREFDIARTVEKTLELYRLLWSKTCNY